jgi:hypothetical protein
MEHDHPTHPQHTDSMGRKSEDKMKQKAGQKAGQKRPGRNGNHPPEEHQFKKGESGNKNGGQKGPRLSTLMRTRGNQPVPLNLLAMLQKTMPELEEELMAGITWGELQALKSWYDGCGIGRDAHQWGRMNIAYMDGKPETITRIGNIDGETLHIPIEYDGV